LSFDFIVTKRGLVLILKRDTLLEDITITIMDSLEECLESMVIVKGRKLFFVIGVNLLFVLISFLLYILELPSFISIPEALGAILLSSGVTLSNSVNRKTVLNVAENIRKEHGHGRQQTSDGYFTSGESEAEVES